MKLKLIIPLVQIALVLHQCLICVGGNHSTRTQV